MALRGRGLLVSAAIIAVAIGFAVLLILWNRPATDDATIDADVVHVAPAVGGRLLALPIRENQYVRRGDLLFQIDPYPYQLALAQAKANLDVARADVDTARRSIAAQRATASVADAQIVRAQSNYRLSTRTAGRLAPLTSEGYVPVQQLDQAQILRHDAATSLVQAREQAKGAREAVNTVASQLAAVQAAIAAVAIAERALSDTTVRAPHDGQIVGLKISTGEMVIPSQSLFTLINTEQWYAVANFREYDLGDIAVGDCATVFSLVDQRHPIAGVVDGLGWGVATSDRIDIPRSVPYVQPELNWVRVAHRFPVRIRLENPPRSLSRLGASAIVEIRHGAACR
jgi:membrane fusion protein, multidrug efflux system